MTALSLGSEKFSPSGGFAADGIKKLLGSPALSALQTVVRETVQNSWDARGTAGQIRYRIELRTLTATEQATLRDQVFVQTPSSVADLQTYLTSPSPTVLVISDWGTKGLGGPTRADVVPEPHESSDFVNFIRNIGMRRDSVQGGGTYGYGKSSLYSMSAFSTVIVDTLTAAGSGYERRLIACHLGGATDDPVKGKLTGRHWWGEIDTSQSFVEPLRGPAAEELANEIGLPTRSSGQTGTSVMVLNPLLGEALDECLGEIQESLLWFFWPKMLRDNGEQPITFETLLEGQLVPMPSPESFAPVSLFVEAYLALKRRGDDIHEVRSERPARLLGRYAIRRGLKGDRTRLVPSADSIIPGASRHIALMRPVELVVKYLEGTPLAGEEVEWGGVFICSTDREVEQAFADAEPPAHDDWVPDNMPKGPAKTFVRVALRELRDIAHAYAYPVPISPPSDEVQPSLAVASDLLGRLLPSSSAGGRGSNGGGGSRRAWKVSTPRFSGLSLVGNVTQATFDVDVENNAGQPLTVRGLPGYFIDGAVSAENTAADGRIVEITTWADDSGTVLTGDTFVVPPRSSRTWTARVAMPGLGAVGLRLEAELESNS